jgi:hypothetical protein
MRLLPFLAVGVLVTACGSETTRQPHAATAATVPPHARASAARSVKKPAPAQPVVRADLPRSCADEGDVCYPPEEFVRALCKKKYQGVAIAMFQKGAPWKHVYVKVKDVAPVNSLGGPSSFSRLEFLEEVLLLREREFKQRQMIIDMPNSYDVLRFDGTCATLAEDEFMTKKPYVRPRYAPVIWHQIDAPLRQTLTEIPKVDQAAEAQTSACRGSFLAGGGEPCKDATQQLARAIVAALSDGLELPLPTNLPKWSVAQSAANPLQTGCPVNHSC